jgi:hypothetical protein
VEEWERARGHKTQRSKVKEMEQENDLSLKRFRITLGFDTRKRNWMNTCERDLLVCKEKILTWLPSFSVTEKSCWGQRLSEVLKC